VEIKDIVNGRSGEVLLLNAKKVWHVKVNPNMVPKQINKAKIVFTLENGEEITLNDAQLEYDDTIKSIEISHTYEFVE
jgi:uncharacterized protein YlzI (FlbEa/FlbD family)